MLNSIEKLREITRRCQAGEPLTHELSRWLGHSLRQFLDHRCHSVDLALGLRFPKGGIPWWREEAIRKRDSALRELAKRFHDGLSPCAQAREICTKARRYAACAWRHDRNRHEIPAHYLGTVKEYLWSAFASGAAMPICERQLRNVLAR